MKEKVDEDGLVYIGNDRSIYNKQNSPSKGAETGVANGDPCTSEALQGIEVREQFAQSSQAAPSDPDIFLFGDKLWTILHAPLLFFCLYDPSCHHGCCWYL